MSTTAHALQQSYLETERLIYDICNRHQKLYGGDFEDKVSLSNELFIKAWQGYNPDIAEFSTWLHTVLWKGLNKQSLKERRRHGLLPREGGKEAVIALKDIPFDRALPFTNELTPDAQEIIKLALSLPKTLRQDARRRGNQGPQKRACIYDYFRGLDWSRKRIVRAFNEIRESLHE